MWIWILKTLTVLLETNQFEKNKKKYFLRGKEIYFRVCERTSVIKTRQKLFQWNVIERTQETNLSAESLLVEKDFGRDEIGIREKEEVEGIRTIHGDDKIVR